VSHVTLKNFKSLQGQDSLCFTAIVMIDGVRNGEVSDDGNGGCHSYHPWELHDTLSTIAKTRPAVVTRRFTQPFVYVPDADKVIDDAITALLTRRDFDRAIKTRILTARAGKCYQTKALTAAAIATFVAAPNALLKKYPTSVVLNLMDRDEAFAIYADATREDADGADTEVPHSWGAAYVGATRLMRDAAGLEPTSAFRQTGSDEGIDADAFVAYMTWALALCTEGAL
jgi:hypothetical protein